MASTRRLVSRARTWSFGACAVSIVPLAGVHAQLAGARGNRGSGSEGIASVHELALSPDGERVVYLYNDPDVSLQFRLFSAPVDDSQPPVELEPPLAPGENVRFFRISPDSHSVVFSIDRPTNRVRGIFSVPIDGSAAALQLDDSNPGFVFFEISPDDERVVFIADQHEHEVFELYSVPLDASEAPVRLNSDLPLGGSVDIGFGISVLGRVVYIADQETDGVDELFAVPLAGGSLPVKLNDALVAGGDVGFFRLDPHGVRVAYRADQDVDERDELYSVPIAGDLEPVKLNGAFHPQGDVFEFAISVDGRRVVYLADQFVEDRMELFSAPLDGHRPERRLSLGGQAVSSFVMPPVGGARLVYAVNVFPRELFSVPLVGGTALRLSPPSTNAAVRFVIGQDGKTVLFSAAPLFSPFHDLYSRPIDASRPAVQLTDVAPLEHGVFARDLGPLCDYAVFIAGEGQEGTDDLFSVPVDASAEPVQLNRTGENQVSGQFRLTPDGRSVVFTNGTAFVYATRLDGSRPALALND